MIEEKKTNTFCFNCNKDLTSIAFFKVNRRDTCDSCDADLHSCKMCEHYDISSYNECRESSADRIVDKEKSNFCDYFSLNKEMNKNDDKKEDLLNKANSLFKD